MWVCRPKLGYIISGACFNNDSTSNMSNATPSVLCCIASSPPTAGNGGSSKDIQDFWSVESIGIDTLISIMTGSVENDLPAFFTESVQYKNERYSVALPCTDSEANNKLLNNYHSAALWFKNLKRRLVRDEELSNKYHSVFVELRSLGIIQQFDLTNKTNELPVSYLPHHPVVRESSLTTKVRPVFDAFATRTNVVSLNYCMNSGTNLLPLLPEVLIRFRRWRYAYSADITKAFLQVGVREQDQNVHRFFLGRSRSD